MSNINLLDKRIGYFVNERIEEEIYDKDKYKDNKYYIEAQKIIEDIGKNLDNNSDIYKKINKINELRCCELVDMMELAYRLGFKDGLSFEHTMFNA